MKAEAEIWQTVEKHFTQLSGLNDAEKENYLSQLHDTDPRLHDLLKELLLEENNLHPIFARSAGEIFGSWQDEELTGKHIGIYRLEKLIGQGAMASVFLARRDDGQFDQSVALKLIKPGVIDDQTLKMFRTERQTLAAMQHPYIARLYDGGVNEEGRPFFTMEYIEGLTVTTYCEKHRPGLTERLQLFKQIAQAVSYAHSRFIAHLDLKPGNILMDSNGQVRVLDFGIARMTKMDDADVMRTEGINRFTLAYASPEQLSRKDADSASDIYALGVILYELILGKHPYSGYFGDPAGLQKNILQGNYPALDDSGSKLPSGIRNTGNLSELEKIWQCAMGVQREERYGSAESFIRDIDAFLKKKPVSVVRKTGIYKIKKFIQRNTKIIAPAAIGVFALMLTILFYTHQVRDERDAARTEALKAAEVTNLLTGIFKMADPNLANGDTVTAVQLLVHGLKNLNEGLRNQPAIKASLLHEITSIFSGLGRYALADSLARAALRITDSLYQGPHPESARSLLELGRIESIYKNFNTAYIHLDKSLDIYKKLKPPDIENVANVLLELSNIHYEKGNYEMADSLNRMIYDIHSRMYKPPHEVLAHDLQMLGSGQRKLGNFGESENYFLQSLSMKMELYDPPHNEIAYTLNHLSSLKQDLGLFREAIPYAEESFGQRLQIYGPVHIETIASQSNLARIYRHIGEYDLAIPIYNEVLENLDRIFPDGHPYTGATLQSLAELYMKSGKTDIAETFFRKAIRIDEQFLDEDDIHRSYAMIGLGRLLTRNGQLDEAKDLLETALTLRQKNLPDGNVLIGINQQALGECLLSMQAYEGSLFYLSSAYESLKAFPGKYRENLEKLAEQLILAYRQTGSSEDLYRYQQILAEITQ
jgi:eukaryotic-like serine/threonine-protein kinase